MPFRTPMGTPQQPTPQQQPAGSPNFGNTPPSVDRLPSPPPFNPPPQGPLTHATWDPTTAGMGMEPLPPNPWFDQGDGSYGPTSPSDQWSEFPQVFPDAGPPIAGPPLPPPPPTPPTAAEIANPFSEHYDPPPQSHDRFKDNYVPEPPRPPRAGSAGLTPQQIKSLQEYEDWQEERKLQGPKLPASANYQSPIR